MAYNKSKSKGSRVEYLVRDQFREWGYEAHRVPASGAAQGFKGDVEVRLHREVYTIEVKARRDEFSALYEVWEKRIVTEELIGLSIGSKLVTLGEVDPINVLKLGKRPLFFDHYLETTKLGKLISKLLGFKKQCDILAVKQDYKPVLFLTEVELGSSST